MDKQQYVTNESGKQVAVLLPIKQYKKIMEDLEELADLKAYDKAKAKKQDFIPFKHAVKEIEAKRKSK